MASDKVRENRLRRMAQRQGLRLEKSRRRDPRALDYGGYMLIEAYRNLVVLGGSPHAYSATLNDVEAVLHQGRPENRRQRDDVSGRTVERRAEEQRA